jgi:hypothetical protein
MSDAVKELVIRIKRDDAQARASMRAYHASEKARIKEMLSDDEIAERAKTAFLKREIKQRIEEQAKAQKTTVELAKAEAKARADAEKEATAATKKEGAERLKAEKAAARETVRAARESAREQRQLERDAVAATKAATAARTKILAEASGAADGQIGLVKKGVVGLNTAIGGATTGALALMRGLVQSSEEATAYIDAMMNKAEATRDAMREISALQKGEAPTYKFTADQAKAAAAAGVSSQEYLQAQTRWEEYAGQYIGEGPEHKLTREQSDALFNQAVTFSAARGIDSGDTAQLLATVVASSPKGTSNQAMMTQFAKAQKVAELAAGKSGPIVRQIAEIAAQEVGAGGSMESVAQAAPFVAVAANQAPDKAGFLTEAMLRGLRGVRSDPAKAKALGVARGMTTMQQLEAVEKATSAAVAGGADEGEFLDQFFPNSQDWRGVRGVLNAGIRGGGFARAEATMAGITDQTVVDANRKYLGSDVAKIKNRESLLEASEAGRAQRYQRLREVELEEERKLVNSGEAEKPMQPWEYPGFVARYVLGGGNRRQQLLTSRIGERLQRELSNAPGGREYMEQHHLTSSNPLSAFAAGTLGGALTPTRAMADGFNFIQDLGQKMIDQTNAIREHTAVVKEQAARDKAAAGGGVPKPAPSKPPEIGRL